MSIYEKFGDYYDLIYQGTENYEKECDALEKNFAKLCQRKPKSILDVGCGTGSHSVILSKRGYNVTGIDISKTMIKKAKEKAKKEKVKTEFFVQDMQNIKLNKKFDCAICIFGGFGYILKYEDLVNALSGLRQHLNKDCLFIFEFWNVGGIRPSPYQSWMKTQDENVTLYRLSESNFDPQTNVLNIDFHFILIRKDKLVETFNETHKIKCYTLVEIRKYLEDNDFKLISARDWDGKNETEFKTPRKETFRILAIAKKS
jgi:SAM-dependent methyltransferase